MKTCILCVITSIFGLMCLACAALAADDELKQISESGITVSYPAGLDTQAKHMLALAKELIAPSLSINKQMVAFLQNSDSMAKDIAELLGYQEKQDKAKTYLLAYKTKSEALVQCFSNIELVKKADAAAKGGLDAGVLQVSYDKFKDEFNMVMDLENVSPDRLKRSRFPVFVNTDGTLRAEKKIGEMAVDFMGSNRTMIIAPLHDAVGSIMAKDLNLYHPFSRWFNDGVSAWITRHVVAKTDPKLVAMANDLFSVNAESKKLREQVNFLCWPQTAFQNQRNTDFNITLEAAQTQYAVEAVSDMLGKNAVANLPKIMREVNFNPNADNEAILQAIKKITGRDFKPTFMSYVPANIRAGINSGQTKSLLAKAEKLTNEKKWVEAAKNITLALAMTPDDVNARLNLAWLERESGLRLDSELQVFLAARLIKQGNHKFHMYAESLEGNYIMGRFAILMGNLEFAKKLLQPVLELKPNHQDAKRALDEIKALENAVGVGQSSAR